MRKAITPLPVRLRVGDVSIDLISRRVTVGDRSVELAPIEMSLLYVLAARRGEVLSRETILRLVWGEEDGHRNVIERHREPAREDLPDRAHPYYIQTVAGHGYRFR